MIQSPAKIEPEAIRIKNSNTAINALGEIMQMVSAVEVGLPGHQIILDRRVGAYIKSDVAATRGKKGGNK
jgi:hypothetical protein